MVRRRLSPETGFRVYGVAVLASNFCIGQAVNSIDMKFLSLRGIAGIYIIILQLSETSTILTNIQW